MRQCYSARIFGNVQGVGYRITAKRKAEELGIAGFVRNDLDGSVYIEAEGEEDVLQRFIDWCEQGSKSAAVKNLVVERCEPKNYAEFKVK